MSESTPEDRLEQQIPLLDEEPVEEPAVPVEADPADAAEQSVVVELDEDERR